MSVCYTAPYLLTLAPAREMSVVWLLRENAPGYVEYGPTPDLGLRAPAEAYEIVGLRAPVAEEAFVAVPEEAPPLRVYQRVARLAPLMPGKRYYYRCVTGEERTKIYDFRTAPFSGGDFRFGLASDLQGKAPCEETVARLGREELSFLLYAGDMTTHSFDAGEWFDLGRPRSFFACMQQEAGGARLMQYLPTFVCPGNHEVDDLRVGQDKKIAAEAANWRFSIFMQIFRPLYPDQDYSLAGRRWYGVDYGDMHIVSLSVQRWATWPAGEAPGWRIADGIAPGDPQIRWLEDDLRRTRQKYKWVILHWHLLNRGTDTQTSLCQPVPGPDGTVAYPRDDGREVLMRLFAKYGVNGVSYGHSHVYERYVVAGTHYIESAYFGVCYREKEAPYHPSGLRPTVEQNAFRSYTVVRRGENGLTARATRAEGAGGVFDEWTIG